MVPALACALVIGAPSLADRIADDMALAHEAAPAGVPTSFNWQSKPRVGMGNQPGDWQAFIVWGQVYRADGKALPEGVRVEIRGLQAWVLSKSAGRWHRIQAPGGIQGAAYREDFAADENVPADVKPIASGVSIRMLPKRNYHFWPEKGRVKIDPNDIGGIVTAVQSRIATDGSAPGSVLNGMDRIFLMSVGADYWKALDSVWDNFKTNNDVGIGRFRAIGPDWQWSYMTTLDREALRRNPPPIKAD